MAQPRPPSLTGLAEASRDLLPRANPIDLMGVVTDLLPASQSRTGEYMLTFTLQDPEMSETHSHTGGLKARFFANRAYDLPQVKSLGDVVLIRQCKVTSFRGAPIATNIKWRTATVVFPAANIPDEAFKQAYAGDREIECVRQPPHCLAPTKVEQMYAILLKSECSHLLSTGAPSNPPTNPSATRAGLPNAPGASASTKPGPPALAKQKLSSINKVTYNQFCDLVVEVVKKYTTRYGSVELYVTDYTTNDQLFDYPSPDEKADEHGSGVDGDIFGHNTNHMPMKRREWPGPYGQRVLMVELLEPHASFADQKVKEKDVVLLQNVRIKMSRDNKMEGNMYTDNRYPNKISVHILKATAMDEVQHLNGRRDSYWESIKRKNAASGPSKQQKKKTKKNKAKASNIAAVQGHVDQGIAENKYVRCSNADVKLSTLASLIGLDRSYKGPSGLTQVLPFINHQRRVKARVVDFFPSALEAFAHPAESPSAAGSDDEMDTSIEGLPTQKWEWDFFLLLEDANVSRRQLSKDPAQSWVHVDHGDAEFLLAMEEDATDLYHNNQVLAKLREKLAILWGNLEERKTAARLSNRPYPAQPADSDTRPAEDLELSNLPFECCIREHGQELDETDMETDHTPSFLRIHSMFGTRII